MKSLTQRLADFVTETRYDDLPGNVVHEVKRTFLDSLGCALGGMDTDKGRLSVGLARRLGGPPESSIIGAGDNVSCTGAAFANGELINALDFDTVLPPATHVTPFVLPPALAMGESRSASGRELIVATVLGHEVSARVASGITGQRRVSSDGADRGRIHWPAVHGYSANVFGSVASAARVLSLDSTRMASALGIAGYNAPMQAKGHWDRSGTDALVKFASAGWMAQTGTTAALLAEMGYTGDVTVLDGDYSFWRFAGSETWRPEAVLRNLGREWNILNMRYKLYPCCGIIHGSLDCFTDIVSENDLAPEEIEQVKVWLDPLTGGPLWQSRQIDTEVQAQFSVAYQFAAAAHRVGWGAEWQHPSTRKSNDIRGFIDRVEFAPQPDFGRAVLGDHDADIARVDVRARGRSFSRGTSYSRGGATPEIARMGDQQLEAKFKRNASAVLPADRIAEAAKRVWSLEELENTSQLMATVARP